MDYSRRDLAERLAGDYVTGTLRGPARRRFESLLPAHPHLREAMREWQARLMPLTAAVPPERPPAAVWRRIEARIAGTSTPVAVHATTRWWGRLAFWRALAVAATAVALSLATLLLLGLPR